MPRATAQDATPLRSRFTTRVGAARREIRRLAAPVNPAEAARRWTSIAATSPSDLATLDRLTPERARLSGQS